MKKLVPFPTGRFGRLQNLTERGRLTTSDASVVPTVPRLMSVRLHSHAVERLVERGATEAEVIATVEQGEQFPVKFGRTGFRRNFPFDGTWRGRDFATKQVEAYAVREGTSWLVISFVTRYF